MTKITEEIKKLLAEKKRMYREAVTYIDKAPKGVLKYHGFFELIIYKHTVVCWFYCISCNKKSNGLNIEDISILCSLSHSLYNACRDYICSCTRQESFLSNALLLLKWWMGLCVRQILLKKKYFSVTVPVQYMSCWTGLNVFDHVRSYDNPFQQTDNHVKLYQKPCARVNSSFAIFGVEKLEFWNSLYEEIIPKNLCGSYKNRLYLSYNMRII